MRQGNPGWAIIDETLRPARLGAIVDGTELLALPRCEDRPRAPTPGSA